jgi:hypothetical protein
VLSGEESVLVVVHMPLLLMFFCGHDRHPPGAAARWPLVRTDLVVTGDPVLERVDLLPPGATLERRSADQPWRPGRVIG